MGHTTRYLLGYIKFVKSGIGKGVKPKKIRHVMKVTKGDDKSCIARAVPLCHKSITEKYKLSQFDLVNKKDKKGIQCPECYRIWMEMQK